jgi:hypothetical protein
MKHTLLKLITILTLLMPSTSLFAIGVGTLVDYLDVSKCHKKDGEDCSIKIKVSQGSDEGGFELILARYIQKETGERIFEPVPAGDKLYNSFSLDDLKFNTPIFLGEKETKTVILRGNSSTKYLKGKDTAIGIFVKETKADRDGARANVNKVEMGVKISPVIVVRIELGGLRSSGNVRVSYDNSIEVNGMKFERFILKNTSPTSQMMNLQGIVKEEGSRKTATTVPVMFETMINQYEKGIKKWNLSIAPGATLYLYAPSEGIVGKKLQIIGVAEGGRRLASKTILVKEPSKDQVKTLPKTIDPKTLKAQKPGEHLPEKQSSLPKK